MYAFPAQAGLMRVAADHADAYGSIGVAGVFERDLCNSGGCLYCMGFIRSVRVPDISGLLAVLTVLAVL